jgi:hypothetical protein
MALPFWSVDIFFLNTFPGHRGLGRRCILCKLLVSGFFLVVFLIHMLLR